MNELVNETQDTPEIDVLEADAPETIGMQDSQLEQLRERKDAILKKRGMHRRGTPAYQRLDEEFQLAKRDYTRRYLTLKKRIERANDKGMTRPDIIPLDPSTQWFADRTLSERRDFVRAHPRFLQIDWPRQFECLRKFAAAPMCRDIMKNFGFSESDAMLEVESILREDLAKHFYGLSIVEAAAILDRSYKPEPFTSLASVNDLRPGPMPASGVRRLPGIYDGYQWCEVQGGVHTHVLVSTGTPDAVVRKIAGCGDDGRPAQPVTNAQAKAQTENSTVAAEVQTEITLTPIERHMRSMPTPDGVPASWCKK